MKPSKFIIGLASLAISAFSLTSCSTSGDFNMDPDISGIMQVSDGTATIDMDQIVATYPAQSSMVTSSIEEWLKYMREEEKVARDLYLAFSQMYGHRTFINISKSEQAHMNAILRLMNLYGIEDPALVQQGFFTNPDLQQLYDQLLAQGKISLKEALKVGILVEETDIADLDEVYELNPPQNVKAVADALLAASKNHLRAFTFALGRI
jgi:hypothetical protein